MGSSLCHRSRVSDRSASGCEQALLRLCEGVIDHVVPAPAAVRSQVGLHAVAHRRGHNLGRQVADHVGPVGVAVSAGVGH
ncbi:MAG: hypothetical protein ACK56F_02250 [bacterium]